MKECNDFKGVVHLYIDNQLTDPEKIKFERHISLCEDCKKEYSELLALKNILRNVKEEEPPANFNSLLHEKLMFEKESLKNNKQSVLKNRSLLIKTSLSLAATILLAITANWAFMNYREFGDSMMQPQRKAIENSDLLFDDMMLPESDFEFHVDEIELFQKEDSSDLSTSANELSHEGFLDSGLKNISNSSTESNLGQNNSIFEASSSSPSNLEDSSLHQSSPNSLMPMEDANARSLDLDLMRSPTEAQTFEEENNSAQMESVEIQQIPLRTDDPSNQFQIRYMNATSKILLYELILNSNASTPDKRLFDTKIQIYTSTPNPIASMLVSLAQFQNYTYNQSEVFDTHPENLYTTMNFRLTSEEYNNTLRTIKVLEEIPSSVQLNLAEPGSDVNLIILIFRD
jgi:hypothetical protein